MSATPSREQLWEELQRLSDEVEARGKPSQEFTSRTLHALRTQDARLEKFEFAVDVLREELAEAKRAIDRNETFIKGDPTQDRPGAAEDLRYLKRWVARIEQRVEKLNEMAESDPVVVEAKIPEQSIEIETTQWKRAEISEWSAFGRKYLGWFLAIALTALAVYWGVTEVLPGLLGSGGG